MSRLDLLTENDEQGQYPASQYAAGNEALPRTSLKGDIRADICIIGGGFTGLSAALSLAKTGRKVVLLEAQRVGFGASGRNGGQIGTGQSLEVDELERAYGFDRARALFQIGVDAHDYVEALCEKHKIDIGYQAGVAHVDFTKRGVDHAHKIAELARKKFGYEKLEPIDIGNVRDFVNSEAYQGGVVDWGAGHGQPLLLALGMAKAAEKAGALIYENSRVVSLNPIMTQGGKVDAPITILACNGYLGNLHPKTSRFVMPINNFIVATKPLGKAKAKELLPQNTAIADSKFVVNYFRLSPDHRLLFGGGESYGYRFPRDIAAKAREPMLKIFPQLRDVKIDYAWGGTLAITMNRMPYVRYEDGLYVSAGYSGHGVAMASFMGHLIANAIENDRNGFDIMAALEHSAFPGGAKLRHPLLNAAMLWYQLRDSIGL